MKHHNGFEIKSKAHNTERVCTAREAKVTSSWGDLIKRAYMGFMIPTEVMIKCFSGVLIDSWDPPYGVNVKATDHHRTIPFLLQLRCVFLSTASEQRHRKLIHDHVYHRHGNRNASPRLGLLITSLFFPFFPGHHINRELGSGRVLLDVRHNTPRPSLALAAALSLSLSHRNTREGKCISPTGALFLKIVKEPDGALVRGNDLQLLFCH